MPTKARSVSRSRAIGVTLAAAGAASAIAQPLPVDPDLVTGTLDNGLSYMILEHANPPGRANMYLHISTGSLNETDDTRGIAHFLEHMAFNGGVNIPPGEVVPYFESLSMSFGQHLNAFTSFDQTAYTLSLPDTEPETFSTAFLFFEDVLFGTLMLAEEIENERGVIMEELRTGKGPDQRVRDIIFQNIAPESTFGRRLPIGTEETINSVSRDDFLAYYNRFYVPSNSTLMIAGDFEAEDVIEMIEERFSRGEKVATPGDSPVGVRPSEGIRAIVATDDELTDADVTFIGLSRPKPPVTTAEEFRASLVDTMASTAINRRLSSKINDNTVTFTSASAFVGDLFGAMRLSQMAVIGAPEDWKTMLSEMAVELRRARLHGFSAQEIEDVRTQLVSGAERRAEREDTFPASARLGQLNGAVATGTTPISADENLELVQRFAPNITVKEINEAFLNNYSDTDFTAVVELPTTADIPSEYELVEITRAALDVSPDAEADRARAEAMMTSLPTPGTVVDSTLHESSGVTSAWLSNGVRIHHRSMDIQEDQASIIISLAGGMIQEDATNRGVSQAAALAWNRPATGTLSSNDIRDLMVGKKVGVGGGAGVDTFTMSVSGKPGELEQGLQLAHLLLTDPLIEEGAFEQWTQQQVLQIEQQAKLPQGQVMHAITEAMLPESEARQRPLTVQNVEALDRETAQAWLDSIIAGAPIEVAIVGDISLEDAMDLATRYIASLPTRERITSATLDNLRNIQRREGPREVVREVETQTPISIALAGSYGVPYEATRDRRAMNVATTILTTRLIERVREAEAQVYSISANSQPGVEYPQLAMVFAASATGPENGENLASVVHEMFTEFATTGPSADEVETARGQILNNLDEQMKQPGYWQGNLSTMTYRGNNIDDNILGAEEMYRSFNDADIADVFSRYYTDDTKLTVVVKPAGQG